MSGGEFSTTDVKLAALARALGGSLEHVVAGPSGRLTFAFRDVPADLAEQLFNDRLTVSAKAHLDSLEDVYVLVSQRTGQRLNL
jgi:hypothetical protein